DSARRDDRRAEQVAAAARVEVVVVAAGGAPGERKPAEPRLGRGVYGLFIDARPARVEVRDPVEEGRILGEAAEDPLVKVMMGVDKARGEQTAGAVDHARRRSAARGSELRL